MSVALSVALQAAVIHTPFLPQAFSTTALGGGDWMTSVAVASSVLWVSGLGKAVRRWRAAQPGRLPVAAVVELAV